MVAERYRARGAMVAARVDPRSPVRAVGSQSADDDADRPFERRVEIERYIVDAGVDNLRIEAAPADEPYA